MAKSSVLIVEDQQSLRESLEDWLDPYYDVSTVPSGEECLSGLRGSQFDVILLDQRLPRMSGLDVLRAVVAEYPSTSVIMMTAFGSVDQAVEAIKLGAEDYLLKPIDLDTLKIRLDKVLSFSALASENVRLRKQLEETSSFHSIITRDRAMKEICDRIQTVAQSDATVLITGDSGTGKELVARAVHLASSRKTRPFVAVACGAIPDTLIESELFGHEKGSFTGAICQRIGKFEEAADGTILLDEIGELSTMAQVKLLRVLQERTFERVGGSRTLRLDARVIAATNRSVEEAIESGEFRQDLYYRINTVQIELPPLRARSGDIAVLAQHFLETFAGRYDKPQLTRVEPDALRVMQHYTWPGNVRELRSVIEQATMMCKGEALTPADLSERVTRSKGDYKAQGLTFHQQMHDSGREAVLRALEEADGVKRDAATMLGLSQRALSHYLKKFGIT